MRSECIVAVASRGPLQGRGHTGMVDTALAEIALEKAPQIYCGWSLFILYGRCRLWQQVRL